MRSFKEKCDTDFGLVQSSLKQLDVSFNMLNTNISKSLEYLYKHYNEVDSQGKYRTVSDFIFGYNEFVSRCKHYLEKDFEMGFKNVYDDLFDVKPDERKPFEPSQDSTTLKQTSKKRNSSMCKSPKPEPNGSNKSSTSSMISSSGGSDQTTPSHTTPSHTTPTSTSTQQSTSEVNSTVNSVVSDNVFTEIIKPNSELVSYVFYDAIVSNVESPSLFWAQMKSNSPKISTLSNDLNDFYNQDILKEYTISTPTVNSLCVARFSQDGNWYRSKILHVYGNGDVHVFYVDFGNDEKLASSEIKRLDRRFSDMEHMACALSLSNACPVNGGDTWSDESIDGFSDMVLEKEIKVKVCNYESCSLSLCQLTLNDKDVLKMLIKKKLAVNIANETLISNLNESLAKYYQRKIHGNLNDPNNNQINEITKQPVQVDQTQPHSTVAAAATTTSFVDMFNDKQKFSLSSSDDSGSTTCGKKMPTRLIKVNDKNTFDITIINVVSPYEFYGCLKHEDFKAYDEMESRLNKYYTDNTDQHVLQTIDDIKVVTGRVLCVIYSKVKKTFTRSIVKKKNYDDSKVTYTVFNFDYGEYETVDETKIYQPNEDFYALPPMLFHCSLDFIEPIVVEQDVNSILNGLKPAWPSAAIDFFFSLIAEHKSFKCSMRTSADIKCKIDTIIKVTLSASSKDSSCSINFDLMRFNHARFSTHDRDKHDTNSIVSKQSNLSRRPIEKSPI